MLNGWSSVVQSSGNGKDSLNKEILCAMMDSLKICPFLVTLKKNGHSSLFFNSGNLFHLIPPGGQVVPGIEKLTWMEHKLKTQKFNW